MVIHNFHTSVCCIILISDCLLSHLPFFSHLFSFKMFIIFHARPNVTFLSLFDSFLSFWLSSFYLRSQVWFDCPDSYFPLDLILSKHVFFWFTFANFPHHSNLSSPETPSLIFHPVNLLQMHLQAWQLDASLSTAVSSASAHCAWTPQSISRHIHHPYTLNWKFFI